MLLSETSHISANGQLLFVGNLDTGVDLYSVPNFELVRTFKVPNCHNIPKDIKYLDLPGLVVSSSDQSSIWIWDIYSEVRQTLKIPWCKLFLFCVIKPIYMPCSLQCCSNYWGKSWCLIALLKGILSFLVLCLCWYMLSSICFLQQPDKTTSGYPLVPQPGWFPNVTEDCKY